jgi:hypothetical protein
MSIPTIQSLAAQFLALIEGALNLTTPLGNKAYNRVLSVNQAMIAGGLYRFGDDRSRANLAQTAVGSDLDTIGAEYGIYRAQALPAILAVNLPAADGTIISVGAAFIGPNGLQYQSMASVTAPSGATGSGANLSLQCLTSGSIGNLGNATTLALMQPIAGVTNPATIISTTQLGADQQTDASYRVPILAKMRAYGGGGNAADYRTWALSVPGVVNAFPYAGLPYYGALASANAYAAQVIQVMGSPTSGTFTLTYNGQTSASLPYNATSGQVATALQALSGAAAASASLLSTGGILVTGLTAAAPIALGTNSLAGGSSPTVYVTPNAPPARSVYVQSANDPNGIASAGILALVTAAIQKNAAGLANQPLGLTMDSLYVVPIICTLFYVQITSLTVPSGQIGTVQTAVLAAVQDYFAGIFPYCDGVDPPFTRNDLITQTSLGAAVQAVLNAYGASCQAVGFGTSPGAFLSTYQLGQGECAAMASGGLSWL